MMPPILVPCSLGKISPAADSESVLCREGIFTFPPRKKLSPGKSSKTCVLRWAFTRQLRGRRYDASLRGLLDSVDRRHPRVDCTLRQRPSPHDGLVAYLRSRRASACSAALIRAGSSTFHPSAWHRATDTRKLFPFRCGRTDLCAQSSWQAILGPTVQ